MTRATGTFDITRWDEHVYAQPEGSTLARVEMGKAYRGDVEGSGAATLLTAGTEIGPAGYVGMEHVSGRLHGRRGTYLLQLQHHAGAEAGRALATVVPGSGTGELRGIRGQVLFTIEENGEHRWTLDYELAPPT